MTSSTFAPSAEPGTKHEFAAVNGALWKELSDGAPNEILMGTAIIGKFGVQERLDAKEHVRSERKRPSSTYIDVRRSFDA